MEQLYAEIETYMPAIEYCLAPKKQGENRGAGALRSQATLPDVSSSSPETEQMLDKHSLTLSEWVNKPTSRIRGLMTFQAAGGLPFVASVHHLATTAFIQHCNIYYEGVEETVTAI